LYPEHEVEQFTDLFWSRIERWRGETRAAPSADPTGAGTTEAPRP
jgi:hypothetical protein